MIIPNIWKNISHVPVTTNQKKMYGGDFWMPTVRVIARAWQSSLVLSHIKLQARYNLHHSTTNVWMYTCTYVSTYVSTYVGRQVGR